MFKFFFNFIFLFFVFKKKIIFIFFEKNIYNGDKTLIGILTLTINESNARIPIRSSTPQLLTNQLRVSE